MLPQQDWLVTTRHKKEIVKLRDSYEEMLCRIIQEGISEHIFRKVNVKMLAYTIIGAANYTWVWYSPRGAMTPQQIADHMSDFILSGIMAVQPTRKRK
jgi:hypothetical protein